MNKKGPIVIIDDDEDDHELLRELLNELKIDNETVFFSDGESAVSYLATPNIRPFLIISDIKMPRMSGFEIRQNISKLSEHVKITPFLFFTTGGTEQSLKQAYSLSVQGLFQKPVKYAHWKSTMENIINYWSSCMAPAS